MTLDLSVLFPKDRHTIIIRQRGVGACYLFTLIDCLLHGTDEDYAYLQSLFSIKNGQVCITLAHSSCREHMLAKKAKGALKGYTHQAGEQCDIFLLEPENFTNLSDHSEHLVETNALGVKILMDLLPYYFPGDHLSSPDGHKSRKVTSQNVASILGLHTSDLFQLDKRLFLLHQLFPAMPFYISMKYKTGRHALRFSTFLEQDGEVMIALINPHDTKKPEWHRFSTMQNVTFFVPSLDPSFIYLINLLFSHPFEEVLARVAAVKANDLFFQQLKAHPGQFKQLLVQHAAQVKSHFDHEWQERSGVAEAEQQSRTELWKGYEQVLTTIRAKDAARHTFFEVENQARTSIALDEQQDCFQSAIEEILAWKHVLFKETSRSIRSFALSCQVAIKTQAAEDQRQRRNQIERRLFVDYAAKVKTHHANEWIARLNVAKLEQQLRIAMSGARKHGSDTIRIKAAARKTLFQEENGVRAMLVKTREDFYVNCYAETALAWKGALFFETMRSIDLMRINGHQAVIREKAAQAKQHLFETEQARRLAIEHQVELCIKSVKQIKLKIDRVLSDFKEKITLKTFQPDVQAFEKEVSELLLKKLLKQFRDALLPRLDKKFINSLSYAMLDLAKKTFQSTYPYAVRLLADILMMVFFPVGLIVGTINRQRTGDFFFSADRAQRPQQALRQCLNTCMSPAF